MVGAACLVHLTVLNRHNNNDSINLWYKTS